MLADRHAIARALEEADIGPDRLPSVLKTAQQWSERLRSGSEAASALAELIERVELGGEGVQVSLTLPVSPAGEPGGMPPTHIVLEPAPGCRPVTRSAKSAGIPLASSRGEIFGSQALVTRKYHLLYSSARRATNRDAMRRRCQRSI
jgi:hypothetical protein